MKELFRWARYFNVPISAEVPRDFPPLTLNVMRSIVAAGQLAGNRAHSLSSSSSSSPPHSAHELQQAAITQALDAFFRAYWVENREITDKDVMADILRGQADAAQQAAELLAVAGGGGEAKQVLLRNTERAFADGAFGLPWLVCENDRGERDGFWGVDHLGVVLDFLGLEKPRAGGWKAML